MTDARTNGFTTGLEDLKLGRWDGDNAMPPASFFHAEKEWHEGYLEAKETWENHDR